MEVTTKRNTPRSYFSISLKVLYVRNILNSCLALLVVRIRSGSSAAGSSASALLQRLPSAKLWSRSRGYLGSVPRSEVGWIAPWSTVA